MAKIKHNSSFDTFAHIIEIAKSRGLVQLLDEQSEFTGRKYRIAGVDLFNFGYCGYLGLEMEQTLKDAAKKMIDNNGLQYGVSRAYITSGPEQVLLENLSKIFNGAQVIVNSSTSSAHIGTIPNLVTGNDAVVLDQQVHFSVQTGVQLCRQNGTTIEMIRHSNLEMLQRKYHELAKTHHRIWYMVDGVYSMYGDTAPFDGIVNLLEKLPKLYLYVDDAHGMSWTGKSGGGYAYSKVGNHPKVVLNVTMGKAFGVTGGVTVFFEQKFYERVKVFGGPLTYSHPLSPAIIGAAIASTQLHLSSKIHQFQWELYHRIQYCQSLLNQTNLPILSSEETPIFFLGLGQPSVAYNMVERLMLDGFYVNAALFPAVSVKCSGIRFSISRHNKMEDIEQLIERLAYHYPKALAAEGKTDADVRKAFRLPLVNKQFKQYEKPTSVKDQKFTCKWYNSINQINQKEWNSWFLDKGTFDFEGCQYLEKVFSGNELPEENFQFKYLVIKNSKGEVELASFVTIGIMKDDFLSQESISKKVEHKRLYDKYYLTTKTLMVGSFMTAGSHIYFKSKPDQSKDLINTFIYQLECLKERVEAKNILVRDLPKNEFLGKVFHDLGFVTVEMPNLNVIKPAFNSITDFESSLGNQQRRYHFRKDVLKYIEQYQVEVKESLSPQEIKLATDLFLDVKKSNYAINYFDYPQNFIELMNEFSNWEFITLKIKTLAENPLAAIILCYKGKKSYHPMFVGLNYEFLRSHKVYKQVLYQSIKRGTQLGAQKIYLGYSADLEKRKLGATQIPKVAFVQYEDNFNLEVLETIAAYEN